MARKHTPRVATRITDYTPVESTVREEADWLSEFAKRLTEDAISGVSAKGPGPTAFIQSPSNPNDWIRNPSSFIKSAESAGGPLSPAYGKILTNSTYGFVGTPFHPSDNIVDDFDGDYDGPESPDWMPNNISNDGTPLNPMKPKRSVRQYALRIFRLRKSVIETS